MSNQEEIIGGVITGTTGLVDDVVTGVSGGVGSAIGGVSDVVGGGISNVAGGIGNAIGGPIGSVVGGVGGFAGQAIGGIGGLAGDVVGGVGGLAGDIVGGVGGAIGGGIDSLTSGLAGSPPTVPELPLPGSGGSKDPCNRLDYIKERLGAVPILGNLSLKDIGVSLDGLAAPKIPEIKIPKPGEILDDLGNAITGGIADMVSDVKAGIGGILEDLSPDKLLASAKQKIGELGREALTDAIVDGMDSMLGPVKAGLGNQLKRSFKQNMLMLGIEEVANIISGEPNILDPCAGRGKDKIKGLTQDTISAAKGGKAIADIKSSLDLSIDPSTLSLKQLSHAQVPVLGDPTLPGALDMFNKQKEVNDAFVEEKVEEAVENAGKQAAETALNNEAAEEKPVIPQEEKFPEPQPAPEGFTYMVYRFDEMKHNGNWLENGDLLKYMNKHKDKMTDTFKSWSPELNKPHDCFLGCIGFEIVMYVQQWTSPAHLTKLPKEVYVGGIHVRVDKLIGNGDVHSAVNSSSVIKSHMDPGYVSRVYNLDDGKPGGDQWPAGYYTNNMKADCGEHPLSYMWDPGQDHLLKVQKIPIMMHINRELTQEEIKGRMQRIRRTPLVWSSFDECVDGLIDWLYNYKLQIPIDGKIFSANFQQMFSKMAYGVYDIPKEYYNEATLLELLDHELPTRMRNGSIPQIIKPSKSDSDKMNNAVQKFKNNSKSR